ncbi:haloacid dehalogenase type II [soil metagenome]
MAAPRLVIFDAIETLFSLDPVRARLQDAGAPVHALDVWFARLLRDAFALTAAGGYATFRPVAEGALRSVLADHEVPAADELVEELFATFSTLPIHADGPPALETVVDAGIPVYVLTNGTRETTERLLQNAEIDHLVDAVVTVHDTGRWKPAPEPYLHAVRIAGVHPSEAALVAVHGWDICGARSAGLQTGWCSRLEHRLSSALGPADATGTSLLEVVQVLLYS